MRTEYVIWTRHDGTLDGTDVPICERCDGTGEICDEAGDIDCPDCHGAGVDMEAR